MVAASLYLWDASSSSRDSVLMEVRPGGGRDTGVSGRSGPPAELSAPPPLAIHHRSSIEIFRRWCRCRNRRHGTVFIAGGGDEAFGVYNPRGTTRTYYVPDPAKQGYPTNLDYRNAQPG